MRWWDTSALLSLVLVEPASPSTAALSAQDGEMVIWWGTPMEGASALSRLQRGGTASTTGATPSFGHLNAILAEAAEIGPSEEVRVTAHRLVRTYPLRAADALQLAAALVWVEHRPDGAGFVCLDRRLRDAAFREGFTVLPEDE
jgi:uncharacterized protein